MPTTDRERALAFARNTDNPFLDIDRLAALFATIRQEERKRLIANASLCGCGSLIFATTDAEAANVR